MSTQDTTSAAVAARVRHCRRSARNAWIGAVAAMLTAAAGGFVLPGPVADLVMVVAMATAAGLSSHGAYRQGQAHVLEELHPDTGQAPR